MKPNRKPRANDLGAALEAVSRALGPFDLPTAAMAVSGLAGAFAAQGRSDVLRVAGLGANVEAMVSAYNSAEEFRHERRPKRRAKR